MMIVSAVFLLVALTTSKIDGMAIPISSSHGSGYGSSYGSSHTSYPSSNHGSSYNPYSGSYKSMSKGHSPYSGALTSGYGSGSHHPSTTSLYSASPFSAALMSGYGGSSYGTGGYYDPYAAYETAIDIHGPGFY